MVPAAFSMHAYPWWEERTDLSWAWILASLGVLAGFAWWWWRMQRA